MTLARAARRLVTTPLVLGWHALVLVTAPLALLLAALVALGMRSSRPLRTVALLAAYSGLELVALTKVLQLRAQTRSTPAGDPDVDAQWQTLVRWVVVHGYDAVRRILGVRVCLERGSPTRADVAQSDGLIVLARHCGPGDTLLIAWLLVVHYGLRLRVVLKALLRVVPTIDLAGDSLPFCFVGPRHADARTGIAELAASLSADDALLLFPEGGNFSRQRWMERMRRLAGSRERFRVFRLRRNEHTLPPRLGGVSAALEAAPAASVLLLAHSGLGADGRDRPWWRLPVHHDMVVRTLLFPAADVPHAATEVPGWLDRAWTQVDTWVDGHAALQAVDLSHPAPPA